MNIFEKIFKKKKPIDVLIEFPKPDIPEVIKEAKIKPTKCARCHSLYQAKRSHIFFERDLSFFRYRNLPYTECPICRMVNDVKFEDSTDEKSD